MKKLHFKNAFTMVELVLVIVVLGILAALAIPRMDRDRSQEASDTLLSAIRYAQHMAINDYREQPEDSEWQKSFWQFRVERCSDSSGMFFMVGADKDKGGDINKSEAALDPSNGKPMYWNNSDCSDGGDGTVSENIFISKKFGVDDIDGSGGCSDIQHIGFDHLGRPHVSFRNSDTPDYSTYMSSDCTFTFTIKGEDNISIVIESETGYAYIKDQNAS